MQTLSLYLVTAVFFLIVDALMLTNVIKPLFERHLGDALRESPALAPAAIFYLFYVAGVVFLASLPALAEASPFKALWMGGLLGAMAYGTYEFTNLATLRNWSWQMVAVDFTWGIVLTGVSAFVGVWTVLRFSG
ncbi:DUF2177 family protein [Rhodobacteraceae bacterium 63075]|nr:DUF2177 family protein [Rhodobacteraceae bacterium 63075]